MLPVSPELLRGVKLRSIGREKLQLQPPFLTGYDFLNQPTPMATKPVPDHQDLARDMAQQMPQKDNHLGTADGSRKQAEVKIPPT